jgi:hypothetical protein
MANLGMGMNPLDDSLEEEESLTPEVDLSAEPVEPVSGMQMPTKKKGNINIVREHSKSVDMGKGKIGTVNTISFEQDGENIVVPTIWDGKLHSEKEAIERFNKTGKNFGRFVNQSDAVKFAEELHQKEEKRIQSPSFRRSEESKKRDYAPETTSVSKTLGFQDDKQKAAYEDLTSFADKFEIPKPMRDALVGQIYNESSFFRDKHGDASQAHGYLQFKGSRLGELIKNYYNDNEELMKIVNKRIKKDGSYNWSKLTPQESRAISEAFESDLKNEEKTIRYILGELNPTGNLEKYGVKSVSMKNSGLRKKAMQEFHRLIEMGEDATIDDWGTFFTKHYVKPKGRNEEKVIKNRNEESKNIAKARSRGSEESGFGFSKLFKIFKSNSEESK